MKDRTFTPAGFYEPPQADLTTLSVEEGFMVSGSSLDELQLNPEDGWE